MPTFTQLPDGRYEIHVRLSEASEVYLYASDIPGGIEQLRALLYKYHGVEPLKEETVVIPGVASAVPPLNPGTD